MTAEIVRAEWVKFRSVRGWVIGALVAVLAVIGVGELNQDSCSDNGATCTIPVGPGGEAVDDSFYFVYRPLADDGTLTARITSLTGQVGSSSGVTRAGSGGVPEPSLRPGLQPWSKAGIIVKADTSQGAAYAAMMATGAHGVRMQYDFTGDIAGTAGLVSPRSPGWLRLVRDGSVITGYDSADGTHWTEVGTVTLPRFPGTVQVGLFAASPSLSVTLSSSLGGGSGTVEATQAIGVFDHVSLTGVSAGAWRGDAIGANGQYPALPDGGFRQADGGSTVTVTGSGDIAPDVAGSGISGSLSQTLVGTFAGLIAVVVLGALFMTAEYRRGLIRVTCAASPIRGRVLAAKAAVLALVTFLAGCVAAPVALYLGQQSMRAGGVPVDPVTAPTMARMVAGTGALLAVAAVLALALATIIRQGAAAVATVIVVIVLPYVVGTIPGLLPASAGLWLLRITPAAGFAIQQAYPRYPQVIASYSPVSGYYPLSPWTGFTVLCCYAVVALALAWYLLRRRDA